MAEPWRRVAARVLLIDEHSRVLLTSFTDPDDGLRIWIAPGGGVETGESAEQAAARELSEEVEGVGSPRLKGPVWKRRHPHTFAGRYTDLTEWYFVANIIASQVLGVTETGAGRRFFSGWQWWSIEELKAFDGILAPRRLPELLRPIIRGDLPVEPIEIGE